MIGTIFLGTLICVFIGLIPQIFSIRTLGISLKWLLLSFLGNLLLNSILVYAFLPSMVGPLGGFEYLWLPLMVNGLLGFLFAAINSDRGNDEDSTVNKLAAFGNAIVLIAMLIVVIFVAIGTTWGDGNTKARANFLPIENIQVEFKANTDTPEIFPDSDPQHIVLVEEPVARYIGSQALGQTGENLGSVYKPGPYTKQNVAGHIYWIAPIIYQNIFANLGNQTSPGYIVVDAENPNAPTRLVMDHKLKYLPEAMFNQDLIRHIYLNGWEGYRLMDATLEVDDNWVPYFTVDASLYQRGFFGVAVHKILVVNCLTGEIHSYNLSEKPEWIDRVLPLSAVDENIDDYGMYYKAPWINFSGRGIEMRADDTTPVSYSTIQDSPVYQYVMTSQNNTDFSSLGVILVNSDNYVARRYPIYGIAVGSKVTKAFLDVSDNVVGENEYKTQITEPVLYNIYDRLTWVTTYVTPSADGMSEYKHVGLLSAYNVNPSNVQKADTIEEALRRYKLWISNPPSDSTEPTQQSELLSVNGEVALISTEVQNGYTIYYFMIRENGVVSGTTFMVNPTDDVNEIRFTKIGDPVTFTYLNNGDSFGSVESFDNLAVPPQ